MHFSPCQAITKALHSAKKTKALLLLLLLFKRKKKKTICIYSLCSDLVAILALLVLHFVLISTKSNIELQQSNEKYTHTVTHRLMTRLSSDRSWYHDMTLKNYVRLLVTSLELNLFRLAPTHLLIWCVLIVAIYIYIYIPKLKT